VLEPTDLYLDYNATAPLSAAAAEAMREAIELRLVNPASAHRAGERSARLLARARRDVAALIGAADEEVVFTSGGTEANHAALFGLAGPPYAGRHVVVSAIEHPSLLGAAEWLEQLGATVARVAPRAHGAVDPGDLLAAVRPDTVLVALMHANNETGVLQPVEAVGAALAARSIAFHVDAAQSAGRLALDFARMPATSLAITAHKIGGPPGCGALIVRRGTRLTPWLRGGTQERARRGGTHALPAILGFAAAARAALARPSASSAARDAFEARLRADVPDVQIQGVACSRLPNTASVTFPGVVAAELLAELSRRGLHASAGSACQAGAPQPSHVLRAMGLAAAAVRATLRFSFGPGHTASDGERGAALVRACLPPRPGAGGSGMKNS
jgi:cysteine desulfurase